MSRSSARALRTIQHDSVLGVWESARADPAAALRPYVREYVGWFEHTTSPLVRRELPSDLVPVIVNFGAPIRILDSDNPSRWTTVDSFTAGVYDTFVLVGTSGPSGGLQIDLSIVDDVGWSQKHLIEQFKEHIGISPKTLARVLRFGRAIDNIKHGQRRLADLAIDCGYYDQAHFARDFRAFAGVTPTELLGDILPDGAGFAVDR
jgi:AraC-like DNA-binding protein